MLESLKNNHNVSSLKKHQHGHSAPKDHKEENSSTKVAKVKKKRRHGSNKVAMEDTGKYMETEQQTKDKKKEYEDIDSTAWSHLSSSTSKKEEGEETMISSVIRSEVSKKEITTSADDAKSVTSNKKIDTMNDSKSVTSNTKIEPTICPSTASSEKKSIHHGQDEVEQKNANVVVAAADDDTTISSFKSIAKQQQIQLQDAIKSIIKSIKTIFGGSMGDT